MKWQRLLGLSIAIIANSAIYGIVNDYRVIILVIIVGIGGVIYGDAK
jgi:hypothetical protein